MAHSYGRQATAATGADGGSAADRKEIDVREQVERPAGPRRRTARVTAVLAAAVLAFAAAACGGDDDNGSDTGGTTAAGASGTTGGEAASGEKVTIRYLDEQA